MKKILALLTALSLLAFGMTCVAAEEKPEEFNSGDYTYVLLDDETVTITGYHGSDSMVTIPDQLEGKMVTGIGDKAFLRCKSMASVTIPDSVTSIGDYAFSWTSLTSVIIPESVMSIGNYAFSLCSSLISVTIPDSVTSIGDNPFGGCEQLSEIVVSPDHPYLAVIDGVLISKPDMRLVCYPEAFTAESYEIPQGIKAISSYAFFRCSSLNTVTIPDGVTSIGDYAFSECKSMTSVTIPDSVTRIGLLTFDKCNNLTVTVSRDSFAKQYCEKYGVRYTCPEAND